MNCKPNDWAMVVRRIVYRCPFCTQTGELDLRPKLVHVTQLVALTPMAMWAIETPLLNVNIDFACGARGTLEVLDALPDRALQPLPKISEHEPDNMTEDSPKSLETTR